MKRRLLMWVAVLALILAGALPAQAQRLLPPVPIEPPLEPDRDQVAVAGHTVQVTVDEQVASYVVTLELRNSGRRQAEADLVMPLPGQAAVTNLGLWIDGRRVEAQLLTADEALQAYTDIVRQRLDPALLEYAGEGALRARVFPVPPDGVVRVELRYAQVLPREGDLVRLDYAFQTSLATDPDLRPTLDAVLRATEGIGSIYSPTHDLTIERSATEAVVAATTPSSTPEQGLVIYYGLQQEGVSASVLSYRQAGEDGHFMLLLMPPEQAEAAPAVSRDVTIVVDTSGSMRGEKLEQARAAAIYVLSNLNRGDRFGLVSFGSSVRPYAGELLGLDRVEDAVQYIEELRAEGGTNIDGALAAALDLTVAGRTQVILFLTDGLPTVGQVSADRILNNLDRDIRSNVRLFAFGVGYDVNTLLLDRAALDHHGTAVYVRPGENIEQRVSSLYDKISQPALTDVALDIEGVGAYDLYPTPLPDLFAGEQLVVVGRYRQPGEMTVKLAGTRAQGRVTQSVGGLMLAEEGGAEHIPAVWAARKVGYLLAEIRLHGAQDELVDEVVALATRYGILTPYTSFLADEYEDTIKPVAPMLRGPASLDEPVGGQEGLAPKADYGLGASAVTGEQAVEQSIAEQSLRDSERPASEALVRTIAGKTFALHDGVWVDADYDQSMAAETVLLGSARYAELLQAHLEWGRWLALGLRVTIVHEGRAYRFQD